MANIWAADHEEGLWLPDWSVAPSSAAWELRIDKPAGGEDLGTYAIYHTGVAGGGDGPSIRLENEHDELYFGMWVYVAKQAWSSTPENLFFIGVATDENGATIGDSAGYAGLRWVQSLDAVYRIEAWVGQYNARKPVSIDLSYDTWHHLNCHFRWGTNGICEIRGDCGTILSGPVGDTGIYRPRRWILFHGDYNAAPVCWFDNFVLNTTAGSFNTGWPCTDPFPGSGFSGPITSDVEIEIELPEFKPPSLFLPRRGDFNVDSEDAHMQNLRALEGWANDLNDDTVHVWPEEWKKPLDDSGQG